MKVFQPVVPKGIERPPPVPLKRAECSSMQKREYLAYELFNIPGEDYSPANQLSTPCTCEEWSKFRDNLEKAIIGQNINRESGRFIIARRFLTGDALAVFDNTVVGKDETNVSFVSAMDAVTRHCSLSCRSAICVVSCASQQP